MRTPKKEFKKKTKLLAKKREKSSKLMEMDDDVYQTDRNMRSTLE